MVIRVFRRADDAEVFADGFGVARGVLDVRDEFEDPVQGACRDGDGAGGNGGHGEGGHGQGAAAGGAGLDEGKVLGAALREGAQGTEPRAVHVNQPQAVRRGVGDDGAGEAEDGALGGDFGFEVCEPGDLIGNAAGVEVLMDHRFLVVVG